MTDISRIAAPASGLSATGSYTRTPVALVIFNRPDLTERVFAAVARARPQTLLVIADGPRPGRADDPRLCAATRAIIDRVDWPCRVLKNYADGNLGCGKRPATGLQWVFEQVEEAIILEDDCLPHPDFFPYCDELLERYRHDERVMHISGDQLLSTMDPSGPSYCFSRYCLSWGWATWRRAFHHYDYTISLWPELRKTSWLAELLVDPRSVTHWTSIFDKTHADPEGGTVWDYQWLFACWAQSGLALLPRVNLISNIGFRDDATHTTQEASPLANLTAREMGFPLRHPAWVRHDLATDRQIIDLLFGKSETNAYRRLRNRAVSILPGGVRATLSSVHARLSTGRAS